MGSVKEEGITHLDPMKILGVTPDPTPIIEEETPVAEDATSDEKAREVTTPEVSEDEEPQDETPVEAPRDIADVRFPIFGSDLQMEITGGMVKRIAGVVAAGNPGYIPLVRIDDSGVVSIQWESTGGSTQSE